MRSSSHIGPSPFPTPYGSHGTILALGRGHAALAALPSDWPARYAIATLDRVHAKMSWCI
jgi:hypothetical protein